MLGILRMLFNLCSNPVRQILLSLLILSCRGADWSIERSRSHASHAASRWPSQGLNPGRRIPKATSYAVHHCWLTSVTIRTCPEDRGFQWGDYIQLGDLLMIQMEEQCLYSLLLENKCMFSPEKWRTSMKASIPEMAHVIIYFTCNLPVTDLQR